MAKVEILKGLPGSGKSYYAKNLVKDHPNAWKRINKDDLRAMIDVSHHSQAAERQILAARDSLVKLFLTENKNVVVDDTNFHPKHEEQIRALVKQFNADNGTKHYVTVNDSFLETPLNECLRRDSLRAEKVGRKVIMDMYSKFVKVKDETRYKAQDGALQPVVLCDIDGTIALHNGRNPYDHSSIEGDLVNEPVLLLLQMFYAKGTRVIYFSGRSDVARMATKRWLQAHVGDKIGEKGMAILNEDLIMRAENDSRPDFVVKEELYLAHIAGKYRVELILDDRDQVVDLWRNKLHLPCFQVWYGDF